MERRKHTRHIPRTEVLVFNKDMFAKVMDISEGGLYCRIPLPKNNKLYPAIDLEILNCTTGHHLKNIHGKVVRCETPVQTIPGHLWQHSIEIAIEFDHLLSETNPDFDTFLENSCYSDSIN